jgi:hypothetical protein
MISILTDQNHLASNTKIFPLNINQIKMENNTTQELNQSWNNFFNSSNTPKFAWLFLLVFALLILVCFYISYFKNMVNYTKANTKKF